MNQPDTPEVSHDLQTAQVICDLLNSIAQLPPPTPGCHREENGEECRRGDTYWSKNEEDEWIECEYNCCYVRAPREMWPLARVFRKLTRNDPREARYFTQACHRAGLGEVVGYVMAHLGRDWPDTIPRVEIGGGARSPIIIEDVPATDAPLKDAYSDKPADFPGQQRLI